MLLAPSHRPKFAKFFAILTAYNALFLLFFAFFRFFSNFFAFPLEVVIFAPIYGFV